MYLMNHSIPCRTPTVTSVGATSGSRHAVPFARGRHCRRLLAPHPPPPQRGAWRVRARERLPVAHARVPHGSPTVPPLRRDVMADQSAEVAARMEALKVNAVRWGRAGNRWPGGLPRAASFPSWIGTVYRIYGGAVVSPTNARVVGGTASVEPAWRPFVLVWCTLSSF